MIARFIIGVLFVLASIVGAIFILGSFGKDRSLPQYSGIEHVKLAGHTVEIYRDSFAIPTIDAQTEDDAYYGLGYVHAQERLFQMDMTRRVGSGTLSELIGDKGIVLDRWARTIGFSKMASWMWNAASSHTRRLLAAYTNGVNDYIQTHRGRYGMEFDGLHYEPAYWKPTDCMLLGRLLSWELNFGFWNDAAFSDIAERVDSEHLATIFPGYPSYGPTILGDEHSTPIMRHDSAAPRVSSPPMSNAVRHSFHQFFAMLHDSPLGGSQAGGGSNSVALSSHKSVAGKPMLENDMHLALSAPSRWFIAHLRSKDGLNVAGFSVPGLPLMLAGRNDDISWGLTNGMIDECDYFILQLDSNNTVYHTPNGTKPITTSQEFIRIKTDDPDLPYRIDTLNLRSTDLGPIIGDLPTFGLAKAFLNTPNIPVADALVHDREPGTAIAFEWNGYFAQSDELGCFFALHRAKNCNEALATMTNFATPCLNLSVASTNDAHIAYQLIGRIPIRNGSEARTLLPRHAEIASEQWQGFQKTPQLPHLIDPTDGYIVSANNPSTADRPNPHGESWEPYERAARLVQLVSSAKKIDAPQLSRIVRDISSPFEYHELRDPILRIYKTDSIFRSAHSDLVTSDAIDYLTNWDGVQDSMDVSTTILNVFLYRLLVNTFHDELGDELFSEFTYNNNVPTRTISRLLTEPNNIWFDDVRSPQVENRDDMIRRSFVQAVEWLKHHFGPDVRRWTWGSLHSLTYQNPVGAASDILAGLANIRSGPNGGSLTTVSQASYTFWRPFIMRVGPSMRMIADMSTHSLLVSLPTGNSGNIFSPHYSDMLEQFKQGQFDELPMSGIDPSWQKLTLTK